MSKCTRMLRQFSRSRIFAFFSHHSEASYVVQTHHHFSYLPLFVLLFAALVVPAQSGNAGVSAAQSPIRRAPLFPTQRSSDQRRSADLTGPPRPTQGQFVFSNVPFNPYHIISPTDLRH